jgi:site-specific DNA recombinase
MRAAIYARVSTERQERQQTIDSQVDALRTWASANSHELSLDHVYTDEGYTGSRLDRPGLDELRDAAFRGDFDVVAVLSPDRLARKYAYQVLLLEELRKAGCEVVFLHRAITDDPQDQLLLQIQGAVAEYERAVLGERFRRGKLLKARQGIWLGGKAPYGYRYVPKRDGVPGYLVVDEDEAALVRLLFTWLIEERMTTRQIVKRLNGGPWSPRSGNHPWSPSVVHHVLYDETYAGTAYVNRYRLVPPKKPRSRAPGCDENTCRQPRPRSEWIGIPVPALIDQETYRRAQDQLARNARLSYRHNTRHSYLLRCLLTCRSCGLAMFGVTQRAEGGRPPRRYYRCSGKDCTCSAREARCSQRMAEAETLEAAVWVHIQGLLNDPESLLAQFRDLARVEAEGDAGQRAEVQKLDAQLKRLDREEGRLIDAYQAEVISLEELGQRRRGLEGRRQALTEQREQQARLRREASGAREVLTDLTKFCERIRSRLDGATLAEKQEILQLLVERIIVGEGSLEIRHVIPLKGTTPGGTDSGPPRDGLRPDGVDPAPLGPGRGPDLDDRSPEAQRPVADRQRGLDRQATGPAVQEQPLPRLLALAVAVGHGDQLLLALGGRPHQDEDALAVLLQADVEMHAVGPDVDVPLALERSLAPGVVFALPGRLEPGDRGRREARGLRPEQGREGLGEVAGADALEVEPGDQLVEAPGPLQIRRQDRRGEVLPLAGRPAVVDPGLLDLGVAEAGLDRSLGRGAVADDQATPGPVPHVGMPIDPIGDLGLDGLGQELAGSAPKEFGQDVLAPGRWPGDREGCRLIHGGVLLGHFGRLVVSRFTKGTPPKSNLHPQLPVIAPAS